MADKSKRFWWAFSAFTTPIFIPALVVLGRTIATGNGVASGGELLVLILALLLGGVGALMGYLSFVVLVYRWLKAGDLATQPTADAQP